MQNLIQNSFRRLGERDEMALMPFITAGYPTLEESMRLLRVILREGADMVEIGIPFSDPVADGPTIQMASTQALAGGTTLESVLAAIAEVKTDKPLILMSYLNPLLVYGRRELVSRAREAGFSGLIIPDLPHEESAPWRDAARAEGLALIPLLAPTSSPSRARRIAESASGFLYYVSVTGITGSRNALPFELGSALRELRRLTDKPVAVGFGISQERHIRQLRGRAHGVVVGSRIVEAIRNGEDLADLIRRFKSATRRPSHACIDET